MAGLPERLMMRGGTYYCRIWVPRDVAPRYGRQIVVTSLRTKDLKTAKSRLARKTVEIEETFEAIRAGEADRDSVLTASLRRRFMDIARRHAIDISDREFAERAQIFARAIEDPALLWRGEIVPLPATAMAGEEEGYTYFDKLAAEGDLEVAIAYLIRSRLKERVRSLQAMRASGNLAAFVSLARDRLPELGAVDSIALARLLLEQELKALSSILDGQPDPSLEELQATPLRPPAAAAEAASEIAAPLQPPGKPISLDELFERWEAEAEPSASTLSTWRGIVKNLKSFLGQKSNDLNHVTPDDIVAWKDSLIKSKKSAATISRGYLSCVRALFRLGVANKLIPSDPSGGIKVSRKVKGGTKMLPYTNDEVRRILELASAAKEPGSGGCLGLLRQLDQESERLRSCMVFTSTMNWVSRWSGSLPHLMPAATRPKRAKERSRSTPPSSRPGYWSSSRRRVEGRCSMVARRETQSASTPPKASPTDWQAGSARVASTTHGRRPTMRCAIGSRQRLLVWGYPTVLPTPFRGIRMDGRPRATGISESN